jgi:thiosulfate reductase cytochrome b subunit
MPETGARVAPATERFIRIERKHPLAIRWFHWLNFPLLATMIGSGLLIYWANDVYRVGIGGWTLIHLFPDWIYRVLHLDHRLAEGMAWHFTFMWLFALNGAAYVLYTLASGEWRYLVPTRESWGEAWQVVLHDLGIRRAPLPRRKFNAAQQITYTAIVAMGALSLLTGLAIYRPVQLSWLTALLGGYQAARFEHFWLTMGYCAFFLLHLAQVVRAGWNNFRSMVAGVEVVDEPAETEP